MNSDIYNYIASIFYFIEKQGFNVFKMTFSLNLYKKLEAEEKWNSSKIWNAEIFVDDDTENIIIINDTYTFILIDDKITYNNIVIPFWRDYLKDRMNLS